LAGIDIPVGVDGVVLGGEAGMSVAPDSPGNLPVHRPSPEHGGTGKDRIWELDFADLRDEPALDDGRTGVQLAVLIERQEKRVHDPRASRETRLRTMLRISL
jgi:hypothetical protein